MACYEKFGWCFTDLEALPDYEARLLAVYFEETAQYQAEQSRNLRRGSPEARGYDSYGSIGDDDSPEAYQDAEGED